MMTNASVNISALPVVTERTYRNPLPFGGDLPTNPDPFVTRYRGRYYCFSSGRRGVNLSSSDDLVTWTSLGVVLAVPEQSEYWAPCMAFIDGRFYLYYSSRPAGSEDPHEECLHVAVCDTIDGQYRVERRLFDTFSLDPHVVRDPTGEWVMFYSTNEPTGLESEMAGTSILVDRLVTPTQLAGHARPIVTPSIDEEIFERNRFGGGRDWYTIEGASYFTHHNRAYLTYSGNAYVGEDYFIGYATANLAGADSASAAPAAPGVAALTWSKHPNDFDYEPLVRRNDGVEGTGHNSIVAAPNLVDDWIVYHGRDAADPIVVGTEQRVMRMDPLFYSGGTLTAFAPSYTNQDAPAQPTIADRFDGAHGLPVGWTLLEGSASLDGDALQVLAHSDVLLANEHRTESYRAEVWVQATRTDAGARAGIVPWFADESTFVEACLDAASSSLIVRKRENGFTSLIGSWPVDATSLGSWSIIRVERTFDTIRLWVDERAAGSFTVPAGPAGVGLRAVRTAARFSAFALTDHVSLFGDSLGYLPRLFRATTPAALADGAVGSPSRKAVVLEGAAPDAGTATTVEFQLEAQWSGIDYVPYASGLRELRIHLSPTGYRVTIDDDGSQTLVNEGVLRRPTWLSVRTLRTADALIVQIGETSLTVPLPGSPANPPDTAEAAPILRRIELRGARLRSLDETTNPHRVKL